MYPLKWETSCQAEYCWRLLDPPVPSARGSHQLSSFAWTWGLRKEFVLDELKFCDSVTTFPALRSIQNTNQVYTRYKICLQFPVSTQNAKIA